PEPCPLSLHDALPICQTGRDRHAVDCNAITAMTTSPVAATVPLPPPVARPHDAQLRQDVRWLAATLGRVVRRLAGEETFRAVEEDRKSTRLNSSHVSI